MKQSILSTLFIFLAFSAMCERKDTTVNSHNNNFVFLEMLGSGGVYSVNYERLVFHKKNNYFTARVGFSYVGALGSELIYTAPVMVNYLHALNKNLFVEAGVGILAGDVKLYDGAKQPATPKYLGMATAVGIRFYAMKRFFCRLDATPFFLSIFNPTVYMFGGISIGYNFK